MSGGASRRFGADKARAEVGGTALILHVAHALESVAFRTVVVAARKGEYNDLGLTTIGDDVPGMGPAGGVFTALRHAFDSGAGTRVDWILVSACDWLGIRPEWARGLIAQRSADAHAILFASDQTQPLLALYHREALPHFKRAIDDGRVRMQGIIDELNSVVLPAPSDWSQATNVNRPSDLPG